MRRWMVPGVLLQYRLNGTLSGIRDGGVDALLEHLRDVHGCRTRVLSTGRTAGAAR